MVAGDHSLDAQAAGLIAERWFGVPSLWVPPPIPSTTTQFFDVTRHTQRALIDSLSASEICAKNGVFAPEPAVPNGTQVALGGAQVVRLSLAYPRPSPPPHRT